MKNSVTIQTTINVPKETITNTLISAFEGGSNYWYNDLERLDKVNKTKYISEDCGNHGFKLKSIEHNDQEYTVKPEDYGKGLQIMAEKYPKHFGDMLLDNGDGVTGDILLQCLVFGNVELG